VGNDASILRTLSDQPLIPHFAERDFVPADNHHEPIRMPRGRIEMGERFEQLVLAVRRNAYL